MTTLHNSDSRSDGFPILQPYSASYWLVSGLVVDEGDGPPSISETLYARLQDELYGTVSTDVVWKWPQSGGHFVVEPDANVELSVVSIGSDNIDYPYQLPTEMQFFVAKPSILS